MDCFVVTKLKEIEIGDIHLVVGGCENICFR